MQNHGSFPQSLFCPTVFPERYKACPATFRLCKLLFTLMNPDLSTELSSFTITTIFVYIPLYKTVNQAEMRGKVLAGFPHQGHVMRYATHCSFRLEKHASRDH